MIGLISDVCCGQSAPQGKGATEPLPARGVLLHIDVVGPVTNPQGKTVSAFASRALVVAGWAVDTTNQLVASNVDVVIDGVPYAAHYGLPRKDVAAYLKDDVYEKSGFEFSMPTGRLAIGSHTLFIRVVGSDGKSFVPSPEITVVLGD
jgi:hypothetical protein